MSPLALRLDGMIHNKPVKEGCVCRDEKRRVLASLWRTAAVQHLYYHILDIRNPLNKATDDGGKQKMEAFS